MKIATGKVRLSYANIWTPKGFNGNPEKYSASLIIPKSDTKTVKKIKDAIAAMMKDQENITTWGKATNLHLPLRDGDTDRPVSWIETSKKLSTTPKSIVVAMHR